MTDAELTLLSLLAEAPRTGDDVQQLIQERGLRDWLAIGFSSVYYQLNRLERQGLLQSQLRPDGHRPPRKVYTLTDAGRGILQTALVHLLQQPGGLGSGFELGLAHLHVLPPAQVYHALTHHRDTLRTQAAAVRRAWDRQKNDSAPPHVAALYTHSLTRMDSELQWLDQFLANWLAQHPQADQTEPATADDASATTIIHRRPTPDRAKQIQRLKPHKPDSPEA